MTLAQSLTAVIIFWAVVGGIGASLLLPGDAVAHPRQLRGRGAEEGLRLVGAAAAIAAAVGPLLGGFITTFLSWRVGVRAGGRRSSRSCCPASSSSTTCPTPGRGRSTSSARSCRSSAWAALVLGILVWQEGGELVGRAHAASARRRWAGWRTGCVRRKREGKPTLLDPDLFESTLFRLGDLRAAAPADRPGRHDDRAADLPADGAGVQRDAGRPVARPAVADACSRSRCWPAGRRATGARPASSGSGFVWLTVGLAAAVPIVPRADSGLVRWSIPLVIAGAGSGCWSRS